MACGCNNLPPELSLSGWSGLGSAAADLSPCSLPQYWQVETGADGKCYNVCPAENMAFEVDSEFCKGAGGGGGGGDLFGGLSQTQVLVFALGAVLLVTVMSRN